ncbi:hypothetical protein [Corallococcus terminator]|uniref:Uncharacterized protein n=1 Tax=Corallococcus terminator TaxID=2316733 RepID=A0A3A8JG26_9BACT|nr:hypothetical protein [Corallococcus terminator]RKG90830.1 hypothetical protein D7V88_10420 [Corallococcus terminator]
MTGTWADVRRLCVAGHFRELVHGSPEDPSLEASRGALPEEEAMRVAAYLRKASVFAVSSGTLDDWFTGRKHVARHHTQTDGVWIWSADLPYYVANYRVAIPEELLQRMRDLDWRCPVLSQQELIAFSNLLQGLLKHRRKQYQKQHRKKQR